eukprot:scaffold71042_cov32-Tisochrysis_lutea.AAC.2
MTPIQRCESALDCVLSDGGKRAPVPQGLPAQIVHAFRKAVSELFESLRSWRRWRRIELALYFCYLLVELARRVSSKFEPAASNMWLESLAQCRNADAVGILVTIQLITKDTAE